MIFKHSVVFFKGQLDFPSALEHDASDFYGPLDFIVGSTIEILQKRMVIYDCDDFTYDFYKHQFEVQMNRDMSIYALLSKPKPESTLVKPPPHTITSVGTPEDSLQNCLHLQPKAPKRDLRKLLSYAGKVNPDWVVEPTKRDHTLYFVFNSSVPFWGGRNFFQFFIFHFRT